jgi:hypothetical protein
MAIFQTLTPDGLDTLRVSYLDELHCPGDASNSQSASLIRSILSTFKFTDSATASDISTWKTYSSAKYSFSFKYPNTDCVIENGDTAIFVSEQCPVKSSDLDGPEGFPIVKGIYVNVENLSNVNYKFSSPTNTNGLAVYHDLLDCGDGPCMGYTDYYYFKDPTGKKVIVFPGFEDQIPLINQIIPTFKFNQ